MAIQVELERRINALLAAFEKDHGVKVSDVYMETTDVTAVNSPQRTFLRTVKVDCSEPLIARWVGVAP